MNRIREAFAGRDDFFQLRVVGGSTAAVLALVSLVVDGVNGSFLLLAGAAAVVWALPWHRLSALKAGPIELSLEQGQIKGAINSIELKGREKERVDEVLARLGPDIERARGGRILWIDDHPRRLIGERRLLRALEIETVVAPTCREGAWTLLRDNDFDLVITSLVNHDEWLRMERSHRRNPAVTFIQWLRGMDDASIRTLLRVGPVDDPVIRNLEVIIYAALSMPEIREMTQPLATLEQDVGATNSLDDLLRQVIRQLADGRSYPIEVTPSKPSSH